MSSQKWWSELEGGGDRAALTIDMMLYGGAVNDAVADQGMKDAVEDMATLAR